MPDAVNLTEKFAQFTEHWSPKIVGHVNDMHVKLVKIQGEFLWHSHDFEDEMFFVVKGKMVMHFRNREVVVNPGEFIIVPRGEEHMPVAECETEVMLFELATTVNTGEVENERTVKPTPL